MKIEFKVTQQDIDKSGDYGNTENCLGCTALNRVLGVHCVHMGGHTFGIYGLIDRVPLSEVFADYLHKHSNHLATPETHSVNLPKKILEQIGYFDQKGETTPDDYIGNINENQANGNGHKVGEVNQDSRQLHMQEM